MSQYSDPVDPVPSTPSNTMEQLPATNTNDPFVDSPRTPLGAGIEMMEIYNSPTDALGIARRPSLLQRAREERYARHYGRLPFRRDSMSSDRYDTLTTTGNIITGNIITPPHHATFRTFSNSTSFESERPLLHGSPTSRDAESLRTATSLAHGIASYPDDTLSALRDTPTGHDTLSPRTITPGRHGVAILPDETIPPFRIAHTSNDVASSQAASSSRPAVSSYPDNTVTPSHHIRTSNEVPGSPDRSIHPTGTVSRTPAEFSQNKLFGKTGILGRPPADEDITRAAGLGYRAVVVDDVIEPKGRKRDFAKRIIGKAKTKIESLKPLHSAQPDNLLECTVIISLDATTQARLYAELELMVTSTINVYLINEFKESRMDKKSLVKIIEKWTKSGRPKPLEFMYDLETQLAILKANSSTVRFHGPAQGDYLRISGILAGWAALAAKLNHRTLCNPDAEVRKYFVDILSILELLGAPEHTFVKLQHLQAAALHQMTG
ncbi:hypothetical protein MMC18_004999 [Xylographa bjoerkii]|nr:hypothetical protein [Xylographa bjoerkii]